ncbi:flagellar export protein FliJ [Salipaludibacillus agaradhaerens]|uniref:flagellar export protein FliJ n=1 Tax=Salipaludibacillus agaradhaerens TaxID=76935 RepID=UPI0021515B46|nr:flagellar export protein FliJ [Salipaludibacillus agaradhaerens]MCR6107069.1 flagellar export protein FliJ [Salipaludibacillus agaradhaerens]MCR6119100.1 flagellar export protein FliJ [Salipaludibacillus agaradhaerens]UJW58151.1 flagellar export protein FliJ [Bacillus sp. A116_S68]
MSFKFALQKVLEVKDFEKTDAERAYTESVEEFEGVATQLYELLKKKEELVEETEKKLIRGLAISSIQLNEQNISFLQTEINKLQLSTQKARQNMNEKEKFLLFKTVDLKKYEKMKKIKQAQYLENEKREELKFLDEVSIQQFVRR